MQKRFPYNWWCIVPIAQEYTSTALEFPDYYLNILHLSYYNNVSLIKE